MVEIRHVRTEGEPGNREGGPPTTEPLGGPGGQDGTPGPHRRRIWALAGALVAVVAVGVATIVVVGWPDGADDATTAPPSAPPTTVVTTTPTTAAPTTEAPATTVAPTSAPSTPPSVDASTAVFPTTEDVRYLDPVAVARAFATDFVGFADPVVGPFLPGDARSGEVEVRPVPSGPVTTVMVRRLGADGSWWVLGAATEGIVVDTPTAGQAVTSPLTTTGSAHTWEGAVAVEVRQDGSSRPLGSTVVTGGGDVMRPFSGQVTFAAPTEPYGAVVFLAHSAQDGSVWQAGAVRVAFPAG
jgi:Immunoglobulin-like domain of bacterial spore germination